MHVAGIVTNEEEVKKRFIRRVNPSRELSSNITPAIDCLYIASRDQLVDVSVAKCNGQILLIGGKQWKKAEATRSQPLENLDKSLPQGAFWFIRLEPETGRMVLGVDRFGMVLIYYRVSSNAFFFSSDPADVIDTPVSFDDIGISSFLLWGYARSPRTLYKDVFFIPGSSFIAVQLPKEMGCQDWHAKDATSSLQTYWMPALRDNIHRGKPAQVAEQLYTALQEAVDKRAADVNGILVSGGLDSTLTLDLLTKCRDAKNVVAVTGAVRGSKSSEEAIPWGREVAQIYGVPHESVLIDPDKPEIVELWEEAARSWITGTHLNSALYYAMARRMGSLLGFGAPIFTGQTADALTEFAFTGASYQVYLARFLFSPEMVWLMDHTPSCVKKVMAWAGSSLPGENISILDDLKTWLQSFPDKVEYFSGLIYADGDKPGIQSVAKKRTSLTPPGFNQLREWTENNDISPYFDNVSSDMLIYTLVRFRLDKFIQSQNNIKVVINSCSRYEVNSMMPLLDEEVTSVLGSMPAFAKRFYRQPKHFLRHVAKQYTDVPEFVIERNKFSVSQFFIHIIYKLLTRPYSYLRRLVFSTDSIDWLDTQAILGRQYSGHLGQHIRSILRQPKVFDMLNNDVVDVPLLVREWQKFQNEEYCEYLGLINKLAYLERWVRLLEDRK